MRHYKTLALQVKEEERELDLLRSLHCCSECYTRRVIWFHLRET